MSFIRQSVLLCREQYTARPFEKFVSLHNKTKSQQFNTDENSGFNAANPNIIGTVCRLITWNISEVLQYHARIVNCHFITYNQQPPFGHFCIIFIFHSSRCEYFSVCLKSVLRIRIQRICIILPDPDLWIHICFHGSGSGSSFVRLWRRKK